MALSGSARKGIERLSEGLSASERAEVLERLERAASSATALAELEASLPKVPTSGKPIVGVIFSAALALRAEADGEMDAWGLEEPDDTQARLRADTMREADEAARRGDKFLADTLRAAASDVDAEDAAARARLAANPPPGGGDGAE